MTRIRSCSPPPTLKLIGSFGGGLERNLRPGTLNVPGIIGMAEALTLAVSEQREERKRLGNLSATIAEALITAFPDVKINGHPEHKLIHNLSLTIPGVEAKALIDALKSKLFCRISLLDNQG